MVSGGGLGVSGGRGGGAVTGGCAGLEGRQLCVADGSLPYIYILKHLFP